MLLARRLVAAGVRFVSLTYGGWDMHSGIKGGMAGQLPAFDQGFATLIRDLDRTGLLELDTGHDFFRIWPDSQGQRYCGPRPLAQGLQRGSRRRRHQAAVSSTAVRMQPPRSPRDDPLTVEDLAMTVYRQLGINGAKKLIAPGNRPIDIVREGAVRRDLIA